jgi:hypothetical protein
MSEVKFAVVIHSVGDVRNGNGNVRRCNYSEDDLAAALRRYETECKSDRVHRAELMMVAASHTREPAST